MGRHRALLHPAREITRLWIIAGSIQGPADRDGDAAIEETGDRNREEERKSESNSHTQAAYTKILTTASRAITRDPSSVSART